MKNRTLVFIMAAVVAACGRGTGDTPVPSGGDGAPAPTEASVDVARGELHVSGELAEGDVSMPTGAFAMVLGTFVMVVAAATMLFTARLSHGDDRVEGRYQAARALPVAVTVFSVASVVGQAVI